MSDIINVNINRRANGDGRVYIEVSTPNGTFTTHGDHIAVFISPQLNHILARDVHERSFGKDKVSLRYPKKVKTAKVRPIKTE